MNLPLTTWDFRLRRIPWFWRTGRADARTAPVTLPHSWNARDTFQPGVRYFRGSGFYRTRVEVPTPPGAGRWILRAGGFYGTGRLHVDGREVAKFDGQFLGFEIDLTAHLRPGMAHWLALDLTNRHQSSVLPGIREPDFVLHGGLATTECRLEWRPDLHLAREGSWAWLGREETSVGVEVQLDNRGKAERRGLLTCELLDPEGQRVTLHRQDVTVPAETAPGLRFELPAPVLRLWSPDDPARHTIRLRLEQEGLPSDELAFLTGFRRPEFRTNQGFFLNGKRLMLRGINRHENMPGFGSALPVDQHRKDAELIRGMGMNFVRLSHYPQHPAFLDACDELGILVYAEIATWKSVAAGRWLRNAKRQLRGMIRRDRFHPSVILWGLGNESRHARAYREMHELAHREDPTRATIYAENHLYRAKRRKTYAICDVYGMNYELDVYKEARRLSRNQVILVSEIANMPDTKPGDAVEEKRQIDWLREQLDAMEGLPGLAGFCIWCFADYATMRKRRYLRYSGVVDDQRRPKAAAAWLRERFARRPADGQAADLLTPKA